MKKILVTGASGFIGRACLSQLQHTDYEIHAVYRHKPKTDHDKVIWHYADILNATDRTALIAKIQPDYLIHLAWIVDHNMYWSAASNIDYANAASELFIAFSLAGGTKAIFLGTCAEYDRAHAVCEETSTALNPDTLYGQCKKQAFTTISELKNNNPHYADFAWLRLFNIYGPREYPERLIPYLFLSYLRNTVPTLAQPHAVRDYIFVDDVASIMIDVLSRKTNTAINIGSGERYSIKDLSHLIHERYFDGQPSPIYDTSSSVENCFVPDISYLKCVRRSQTISLNIGLDRSYDFWSANAMVKK